MKPKTLLTLVGLVSLLWSARCASQTSIVPWSASGMGYKVSSSSTSIVKALVGQGFVGTMKGANSLIEAGFLVDTLFRTTVTSVAGPPELPRNTPCCRTFPTPATHQHDHPVRSLESIRRDTRGLQHPWATRCHSCPGRTECRIPRCQIRRLEPPERRVLLPLAGGGLHGDQTSPLVEVT